ncbi:MAG: hypothetical protein ACO1OB_32290 [Archangium sp.]
MSRFSRSLAVGAVVLAALAHATTLLAMDVAALAKGSGTVVRGTVKSTTPRWTKDGARIMTDAVIEVRETWKGTHRASIVVMQQGGVIGDVGQTVHGTISFLSGDDVVLFLEPRGERFLLTGMMQGVFRVDGDTARQAIEGDALFLDPFTRQPVQPPALTVSLNSLRAQVVATLPSITQPTGPVKTTP